MKRIATVGLALLALAAPLARAEEKKAGKIDAGKLVGTWSYTSGIKAGEKVDENALKGDVVITKDTFTLPAGEGMPKFVIGYTIDASATPAKIDLDIKDGPVKEGKAVGIISLDGNTLKLAYVMAIPGQDAKRPEKFESTKDNNAFLFVLKKK